MRKPFTLAPMLGVRGIPEGANKKSAGFFLWQTRKGMRFRSVETLTQTEEFAQEYAFDRKNEGVENPFHIAPLPFEDHQIANADGLGQ